MNRLSAYPVGENIYYVGEWWEYEYATAEYIRYRSKDGCKALYVNWDNSKEIHPHPEGCYQ